MDPLTALSLASGVIQLVDFSTKVARESYSLIRSSEAMPDSCAKLADINKQGNQLCTGILKTIDLKCSQLDDGDRVLKEVVGLYRDRATSLQTLLDKLTVQVGPNGEKSIVKQIKVGFSSQFKRGELESKVKDLEQIQGQLTTALLHLIR